MVVILFTLGRPCVWFILLYTARVDALWEFLEVLRKHGVVYTTLPSINIWLIYVLVFLVLVGVFNTVVAALFFVLAAIVGWSLHKEVKSAFRKMWYERLPLLKFHLVLVALELGGLLFIAKLALAKVWTFTLVRSDKYYG